MVSTADATNAVHMPKLLFSLCHQWLISASAYESLMTDSLWVMNHAWSMCKASQQLKCQ
jgi:hypothetical protein